MAFDLIPYIIVINWLLFNFTACIVMIDLLLFNFIPYIVVIDRFVFNLTLFIFAMERLLLNYTPCSIVIDRLMFNVKFCKDKFTKNRLFCRLKGNPRVKWEYNQRILW